MSDVRAITVKQPWAWAIAAGHKLVENRSRGTSYRGTLLIHAGLSWSERGANDPRVVIEWATATGRRLVDVERVPEGGTLSRDDGEAVGLLFARRNVLAVAQLVDSHPDAGCCRPWGESSYTEGGGRLRTAVHHLVLEDVVPLPIPVPARGALGLWRPPADVVTEVSRQLGGA